MSDLQSTTVPAVEATEPAAATTTTTTALPEPVAAAPVVDEAPQTETAEEAPKTETTEAAPVAADETKATEPVAEKTVEPISEGLLAYKGPGLVKSLIPSKKSFWLSDEAVAPANLNLYLRGEKPEIAHPVAAHASQTGKGLLFVNKKNETDKTHPADVLALYDATDLKKQSPHEFSFKLNGGTHTFKAANDAERDGWYMSIEKAIELGKASNVETRESEGYKSEFEKLTPAAAAAAVPASKSKKSTEVPAADRIGSSDGEDKEVQKKQKSRSTSRGMLNRLKGKKEEKEAEKEEKKEEKEEKKTDEAAPVADSTEAAPIAAAVAAESSPAAAEAAETKPVEETSAVEERPKASKRTSIFGKAWGSMKSPAKEKEQKDAELKEETPKDAVVSENPPVLPETATTEPVTEPAVPVVEEPATEAPKEEVTTPSKEKTNFLSGLGFMKRNRSVSPSTHMKEPAKKEETAVAPVAEETPIADAEAPKVEEPIAEAGAVAEPTTTEAAEEPKTSTANKRQSVLGSLGRRASKALNRMQAPKKENAAPAEATKEEEATEAKPMEEAPLENGETKAAEPEAQKSIGDVVPDAVNVGQPQAPTVTASA